MPATGDEAAVKKALDDYVKALLIADVAALRTLVTDQFSLGHATGPIHNKAEFLASIAERRAIYKSITVSEPNITVLSDVSVVRHSDVIEVEARGQMMSLNLAILQVWVKNGGAWKLMAHQGTKH